MKRFEELKIEEKKEIRAYFTTWLSEYSYEVINKVMAQAEDIINNDVAMMLLKELHERTQEEKIDFERSIGLLLDNYDIYKEYNPHNHPLTHADSYRNVLYDMYIK